MSYMVRIVRLRRQFGVGGLSPVGSVRWSREFADMADAQREARAWNGTGEFSMYAPADFHAEVVEFAGNSARP